MDEVRKHINRLDMVIITALAERMSLMPDIVDEKREIDIMKRLKKISAEHGLDESFVEEIFLSCFNEAKRIQQETINNS